MGKRFEEQVENYSLEALRRYRELGDIINKIERGERGIIPFIFTVGADTKKQEVISSIELEIKRLREDFPKSYEWWVKNSNEPLKLISRDIKNEVIRELNVRPPYDKDVEVRYEQLKPEEIERSDYYPLGFFVKVPDEFVDIKKIGFIFDLINENSRLNPHFINSYIEDAMKSKAKEIVG
jgi:hypothetical protein